MQPTDKMRASDCWFWDLDPIEDIEAINNLEIVQILQ